MNKLTKILKGISTIREITFVFVFVNFLTDTIPHAYAMAFYAFLWAVEHFFKAVRLAKETTQYEDVPIIPDGFNDGLLNNHKFCMCYDIKLHEWEKIARYWRSKHTALVKEYKDKTAKHHIDYMLLNLLAGTILILGELF